MRLLARRLTLPYHHLLPRDRSAPHRLLPESGDDLGPKATQRLGPHGQRTGPSVCTSGSSATPKRSSTRRRPSAISATISAVVAAPVFSMKLACLGAKRAPPTPTPLQPASARSKPADRPPARGSSGFLKVDPNVLIPCG